MTTDGLRWVGSLRCVKIGKTRFGDGCRVVAGGHPKSKDLGATGIEALLLSRLPIMWQHNVLGAIVEPIWRMMWRKSLSEDTWRSEFHLFF